MNIVTGCSGVDAIAYIATLLDIDLIGQIEIDEFCNEILELRYPGVKRLKNVFDVRGDEFGTVDIFAFGDPCQPHSVAGKQKGTADERYIWPELFRIIKTMRPTWIINENVVGSVSNRVVLSKINDLESEGYRTRTFIIPACSVGAPHQRYRVFIVAYYNSCGYMDRRLKEQSAERGKQAQFESIKCDSIVGNSELYGRITAKKRRSIIETSNNYTCRKNETCKFKRASRRENSETMANTESKQSAVQSNREYSQQKQIKLRGSSSENIILVNTSSTGRKEFNSTRKPTKQGHNTWRNNEGGSIRSTQSGMGGNVDGVPGRIHEPREQDDSRGIFEAFETIFTTTLGQINWPAGYGAEQYDYEPPRVAIGVKNRTNRIKALGNAIVPWQLFGILTAIKLIKE